MKIIIYGATAIAHFLKNSVRENVDVIAFAVDRGYEDRVSNIDQGGGYSL